MPFLNEVFSSSLSQVSVVTNPNDTDDSVWNDVTDVDNDSDDADADDDMTTTMKMTMIIQFLKIIMLIMMAAIIIKKEGENKKKSLLITMAMLNYEKQV